MVKFMLYFIFVMYLSGLWLLVSKRKYFLITLLSLEYMVLSVFLCLALYLSWMLFEMYYLLVFLVFIVCEGALGLSILVMVVRSFGNDYIQSFSILRC